MRDRRKKRLMLCIICVCAAALMPMIAALSCYAEDYPDISKIDSNLYYPDNQQFFRRPGTGFVLISSNASSTRTALLDSDGNLDYGSVRGPTVIKFVYEAACLSGNYLYLAGMSPSAANCAVIGRLDLSDGKCIVNNILSVSCDFSRNFSADAQGRVTLVIVPYGEQLDAGTPASSFLFDGANNNGNISPEPPGPDSSSPSSEAPDSSAPESGVPDPGSSSSSPSDQIPADLPSVMENYDFPGPVTLEALQGEMAEVNPDQSLRVFTADKKEIKGGNIGTGQTIVTMQGGKTAGAYIAVIPGDLDGSGTVTDYDCRLLYEYFIQTGAGDTPSLSGPYLEAAKISDESGADRSGRSLQTGDLLKIKKLIK
ncbi:hypothetical protein ACRQV7_02290 [Caproiciproducens sp. R2]|uniref:hypothetical protein n=1 Tax=Caproiciproducens sp. R2 TaxID=3435187 RepID=UPI0040333A34